MTWSYKKNLKEPMENYLSKSPPRLQGNALAVNQCTKINLFLYTEKNNLKLQFKKSIPITNSSQENKEHLESYNKNSIKLVHTNRVLKEVRDLNKQRYTLLGQHQEI